MGSVLSDVSGTRPEYNPDLNTRRLCYEDDFDGMILLALALSAGGQDKPRMFVQGKGSEDAQSSGSGGGGSHGRMGI